MEWNSAPTSIQEWLDLVNPLLRAKGKPEWVVNENERRSRYAPSMYNLTTIEGKAVNPKWGKRFKKYDRIVEMLIMAYVLLNPEDNN